MAKFTQKISELLGLRGIGVTGRNKRVAQVLRTAGIKVTPENLAKYDGMNAKEVFQQLKGKGKLGDKKWLDYAANNPQLYEKATQKYNTKYGAPSARQLEIKKGKTDQQAAEYYAPDVTHNQEYTDEQKRRYAEDLGVNQANLLEGYNRNVADTQASQDYLASQNASNLASDAAQQQLENQDLMTSLNASGQYDSGLEGQRKSLLAAAQGRRSQGINDAYNYANTGYDNALSRASTDLSTNQQMYQRNYDRGVYDVGDYYTQQQRNLDRQQQQYSNNLLTGYTNRIANNSSNYYNDQANNDQQANDFLSGLYSTYES